MLTILSAALIAGLMGSPHCIAMCGPFAMACGGRVSDTLVWHTGKLVTYTVLGAIAGGVGAVVPGPRWISTAISAALVVWFAAALAGWAPEPARTIPGVAKAAKRAADGESLMSRFAFGVINGLLPCGLVYATLGIAVAAGSTISGASVMLAFGLGTVPALSAVALGARRLSVQKPWARRVVAAIILITGLWTVLQRSSITAGGGNEHLHDISRTDGSTPQ